MAALTKTTMTGNGQRTATVNTLTASDTFEYESGDILILENGTAGALTPNLDGDGASSAHQVEGVGPVDLSSGYSVGSVPAGVTKVIPLDTVRHYLSGTVTITGGDGMSATILRGAQA